MFDASKWLLALLSALLGVDVICILYDEALVFVSHGSNCGRDMHALHFLTELHATCTGLDCINPSLVAQQPRSQLQLFHTRAVYRLSKAPASEYATVHSHGHTGW